MILEKLFEDTIYPEMKKYVETNSIYNPKVTHTMTQESNKFPIAPTKLLPTTNSFNNLTYGEETYVFGIDINVYAINQTINGKTVSKRTICNEVMNVIVKYFKTNYHVTVRTELDISNIDSDVHRNNIKVTGKLDTKYGLNNLIIYPK